MTKILHFDDAPDNTLSLVHSMLPFSQISVCLNQYPYPSQLCQLQAILKPLSQHLNRACLFLKGHAIQLLFDPPALLQVCKSITEQSVNVLICSSAYEAWCDKNHLDKHNHQFFEGLTQKTAIHSCEIAGLGAWIECTQNGLSIDFSTIAFLPEFVAITAHPATALFIEQLDLTLAAAAFDLEPTLLLLGDAAQCLTKKYDDTPQGKKLAAGPVYGIKQCLTGTQAYDFICEKLDQKPSQATGYYYNTIDQNRVWIPAFLMKEVSCNLEI